MNIQIEGVHYHISETTKEFINGLVAKLHHDDMVQDLTLHIEKNSNETYELKADIHFKWNERDHIGLSNERVLYQGIETLMEKVSRKIKKAAEKHRDKR